MSLRHQRVELLPPGELGLEGAAGPLAAQQTGLAALAPVLTDRGGLEIFLEGVASLLREEKPGGKRKISNSPELTGWTY